MAGGIDSVAFSIEFGLLGLIFLVGLALSIPLFVGVIAWQAMRVSDLRKELRRREHLLPPARHASRSEIAYETFIRTISHQLSNALQAILGASANLALTLFGAEENVQHTSVQRYLDQIDTETKRLIDLTAKLRLLAQLESENAPIAIQPVQLRSVIADVIMRYAERAIEQDIELLYHGPEHPPRVLANRDQITVAVDNLVGNSLKYASDDSRQIVLGITPKEDAVQISVSDDGVGIPADFLPDVFDDAYRAPDAHIRRRGGAGLGLAIVRRIAQRHHGEVEIYSQYGHGTTVTLTLPLQAELPDPTTTENLLL